MNRELGLNRLGPKLSRLVVTQPVGREPPWEQQGSGGVAPEGGTSSRQPVREREGPAERHQQPSAMRSSLPGTAYLSVPKLGSAQPTHALQYPHVVLIGPALRERRWDHARAPVRPDHRAGPLHGIAEIDACPYVFRD
jgi:hypothetical protein